VSFAFKIFFKRKGHRVFGEKAEIFRFSAPDSPLPQKITEIRALFRLYKSQEFKKIKRGIFI
jgi:hypothetical protein